MSTTRGIRSRSVSGLVALSLLIAAAGVLACQNAAPNKEPPVREQVNDAAGFKEFSDRVQAYVKLQRAVEASLPALRSTDLPELIAAHQQALARKLREARPNAKPGDVFTPAAVEVFRRASRAKLEGPQAADSRAYMLSDAPDPSMRLTVNGIYPDTEPVTPLSPGLLAAYPPLPAEVAYRIVDRALILIDVKSSLIIDAARLILPPA